MIPQEDQEEFICKKVTHKIGGKRKKGENVKQKIKKVGRSVGFCTLHAARSAVALSVLRICPLKFPLGVRLDAAHFYYFVCFFQFQFSHTRQREREKKPPNGECSDLSHQPITGPGMTTLQKYKSTL